MEQKYTMAKTGMNRMRTTMMLAALAILSAGCTDESRDRSEGHALDTQQQALERARDVEDDLADAAKRQRERIEEQEGGG